MKTKTKRSVKKDKISPIFWVVFAVLVAYVISLLIPLAWGLLTSLKSSLDFNVKSNVLGFPNPEYSAEEMKFGNYSKLIKNMQLDMSSVFYSNGVKIKHTSHNNIFDILINTILYCGGGAFILAIVPFSVAYITKKFPFKFSKVLFNVAIVSMVIPSVGNSAAELTMLRNMGLYDSIWGNYLQKFHYVGNYYLIFCAYFATLSDGYAEAAVIDGASQFQIFFKIIIPLSSKMILTIFMLDLVALWNDYQTPLLYLPTFPTLAYAVHYMVFNKSGGENTIPYRISACMLLGIPMLVFFIIFRDKIMGNVTMGGLKE